MYGIIFFIIIKNCFSPPYVASCKMLQNSESSLSYTIALVSVNEAYTVMPIFFLIIAPYWERNIILSKEQLHYGGSCQITSKANKIFITFP